MKIGTTVFAFIPLMRRQAAQPAHRGPPRRGEHRLAALAGQLLTAEPIPRQLSCPRRIAADGVKNVAASKITRAHRRVLAQGAAIQAK
jgi:hypothetical protein